MPNKLNDKRLKEFLADIRTLPNNVSKNVLADKTFWYAITENENIETIVITTTLLSYTSCAFGLLFVVIGVLAVLYRQDYLSFLGMFSILQVFVGPFAYLSFKDGKRVMFPLLVFMNLIWIGSALTFNCFYIFLEDNDSFDNNVMLHLFFLIYLIISVFLQVYCLLLSIKLDIFLHQKIPTEI